MDLKSTKRGMKNKMKAAENEMEYSSERLYDALVQSTDDFIYICNPKTDMFRYPPALVALFALPGEIVENPLPFWKAIIHPEDWERFYKSNMEIISRETDGHSVEFRAKKRNGEYVWLRCRGHMMYDKEGKQELFAGIMSLMGKQNKIDPLTQLLNYAEFYKALEKRIRGKVVERLAVIVIDVDEFRQVNELYSRSFGDKVLKEMGQAIQAVLPDNAFLYRMEKDKMGILMDNAAGHDVESLYRAIQDYLLRIREWNSQKLNIEISAGCAMYPKNGKSVDELCRHADYALQYAKVQGKNRLVFFTEEILQEKNRSLELLCQLRDAAEQNYRGFYLNYQPQVNPVTGEMKGVEVLMRWRDEEGRVVSPAEFIPLMEEHRMIYRAGLWMLRQAFRESREWIKKKPDFSVSVNVSALQFLEDHFLEDLYRIIEEEEFSCKNLIVELTESYAVKNIGIFREKFHDMRSRNIRTALDDFGTGYCSLAALKNTPVDIVKIDRAFVKDILHSEFDAAFIGLVVQICHTIEIQVCLEGVEKKEEQEFLKTIPLDYMQGYYFGRPMAKEDITKKLEKG